MAKALKCDRCGNYFDKKPANRMLDVVNRYDKGRSWGSTLDLCSNCYSELREFLHLEKEDTNEQMEASDTDDTDNS